MMKMHPDEVAKVLTLAGCPLTKQQYLELVNASMQGRKDEVKKLSQSVIEKVSKGKLLNT